MKQTLKYVGIDYWNRPVFKDENDSYFGSVDILFNSDAPESEVLEKLTIEDILYFGTHLEDDPLGTSIDTNKYQLPVHTPKKETVATFQKKVEQIIEKYFPKSYYGLSSDDSSILIYFSLIKNKNELPYNSRGNDRTYTRLYLTGLSADKTLEKINIKLFEGGVHCKPKPGDHCGYGEYCGWRNLENETVEEVLYVLDVYFAKMKLFLLTEFDKVRCEEDEIETYQKYIK